MHHISKVSKSDNIKCRQRWGAKETYPTKWESKWFRHLRKQLYNPGSPLLDTILSHMKPLFLKIKNNRRLAITHT